MSARKIRKLTNACVCIGTATAILISPMLQAEDINYTKADKVNNTYFVKELSSIEEDYNINFKNEELYKAIAEVIGSDFTIGDLRNIKSLTLNNLTNNDLSDLKYLINLESLTISSSTLNASDLVYNQKLTSLNVISSTIKNSTDLPNTIRRLQLANVDVIDDILFIPYNTTDLRISGSYFSNLRLKNPSNLTTFSYESFSILDFNELETCENLISLNLRYCPNIKNSVILPTLPNLRFLYLDDYAAIWLSKETLSSLTSIDPNTKEEILSQIIELDNLAESLVPYDMSDEEKVRNITLNVANTMQYDYSVNDSTTQAEERSQEYNKLPISYALEGYGVCINYACLFQALANRVGLDSYQDISENHTWNMVELDDVYHAFDSTNIDGDQAVLKDEYNEPLLSLTEDYQYYFDNNQEDYLYYYDFNPETVIDNSHNSLIREPKTISEYNIGYVSDTTPQAVADKLEIQVTTLKKLLPLVPVTVILNIVLLIIEKKQKKRRFVKK